MYMCRRAHTHTQTVDYLRIQQKVSQPATYSTGSEEIEQNIAITRHLYPSLTINSFSKAGVKWSIIHGEPVINDTIQPELHYTIQE